MRPFKKIFFRIGAKLQYFLYLCAFCPYIFVITTADNDNNNNNKLNDNKYEKKD